jgi:hypothetical protein
MAGAYDSLVDNSAFSPFSPAMDDLGAVGSSAEQGSPINSTMGLIAKQKIKEDDRKVTQSIEKGEPVYRLLLVNFPSGKHAL